MVTLSPPEVAPPTCCDLPEEPEAARWRRQLETGTGARGTGRAAPLVLPCQICAKLRVPLTVRREAGASSLSLIAVDSPRRVCKFGEC